MKSIETKRAPKRKRRPQHPMRTEQTREDFRKITKSIVRGVYDVQKLRIQTGNRVVANFRAKLGIPPGKEDSKEIKKMMRLLKADYDKITDAIVAKSKLMTNFPGTELISSFTEYALMDFYLNMIEREAALFHDLKQIVEAQPLWKCFLQDVKGCGPAMAGIILAEIDIHNAKYPSSLWKYAGLDVAQDGKGRSRRKEHLIKVKYKDKNGEDKEKDSITFNPFLKTKLMGVLAGSFLKAKSPYRELYDGYKHRLEHHAVYGKKEETPGHRHNMALRYMVKRFLVDLHTNWRRIEGLPVHEEYAVAKLGYTHGQGVATTAAQ